MGLGSLQQTPGTELMAADHHHQLGPVASSAGQAPYGELNHCNVETCTAHHTLFMLGDVALLVLYSTALQQ